ncbi:MAG TPA: ABC transporter permease [Cyclobacteriaceae bacterium]|nr:ABC transporter permease [Cyclobacteriaceae bacterium]
MIKNYFMIAWRGLTRNKSYAFINMAGLGLGITTCLIIFLVIRHEMSFDNGFAHGDRIYRVVSQSTNASGESKSGVTPYPLGPTLKQEFPELLSTGFHFQYQSLVSVQGVKSYQDNIVFADSSFFDVFSFSVTGNPRKELAQPGKIFITRAMDEKLNHPKTIRLGNLIDMEVVGLIDLPKTPSHIAVNMVASLPTLTPDMAEKYLNFELTNWGLNSAGFSYVLLPESVSSASLEAKFPALINKYYKPDQAVHQRFTLQPLRDIHFNTEYSENPGTASVSNSMLIVLGAVGLFILVIACVNFINLSTALAVRKAKEVGVRKTLGAQQGQLAVQYLSEAFMLTLVAGLLSLGAAEWLAPWMGQFLEKDIAMNLAGSWDVIGFMVLLVGGTAVLSGLYPALVLSRFNPVQALKSRLSQSVSSGVSLRKLLVVFQFFIAQVLIISTLVVASQLSFFRNKSLGFVKEAVVNVGMPENKPEVLESFRNRLVSNAAIKDVSFSLGAPIADNNFGTNMSLPEKPDESFSVSIKPVDRHYKDVYGLELVAGRWFEEGEEKMATGEDPRFTFIVNETTVSTLGFSSPEDIIGKQITTGLNHSTAAVVGVVKDFHTASLKNKLNPVILLSFTPFYYDAGIKISGDDLSGTMKFIEDTWQGIFPDYLIQSTILDQYVDRLYRQEDKMFRLFEIFAGIAIFIGCLGLYGLASFLANQKTKEVAIRKTLGASVTQIVTLFSREFVVLVFVAFLIAAPVSWYFMSGWLEEFAFRVEMGWVVFAAGVGFTLIISFATVGYRSLRAAVANPVDALKAD